ncbi:hypothetical protein MLD38_004040 [Melastoma candidum]|uniref:Uncharacterized protein n=1 Tax=Melastoma candidum TaxID=119954 RepID=A0ACB9S936_9MYRT|nr:hypothetical protein MLD38_004040 [Melastoma candidum]
MFDNRTGEWGDHVTLQAAVDLHGVRIFVITSFKDTCYIEILSNDQRSNEQLAEHSALKIDPFELRFIFLSFWAEVHYNSIHLEEDVPTFKSKKKKGWRKFRNKRREWSEDY